MKQLPLPIRLSPRARFANFVAGVNSEAVACLQNLYESGSELQVLVWGAESRGKSHLLQALCHQLAEKNRNAVYIPLKEFQDADPRLLHGLEQLDLVCVDDIHLLVGDEAWAMEIFNLINRARENSTPLVLSSVKRPQDLEIVLPDLQSRLLWGPVFHLKKLNDSALLEIITRRGDEIGLEIPAKVALFLLKHCRRDIGELLQIIDVLDHESMAQKRKVTLPLVRSVIEDKE